MADIPTPPPGFHYDDKPPPPPGFHYEDSPSVAAPSPTVGERLKRIGKSLTPSTSDLGGVDTGKGGILSRIGTAIAAGPTATAQAYQNPETRSGAELAAGLATGPVGAEIGGAAGEAMGLGKLGMTLARTIGMTAATAPLNEKDPIQQAGWTAGLGLVSEGLLSGGGQYAEEAERAESAARVTGEMTPAKVKTLGAQRVLLATAGKTPEEVQGYINSEDAARQTQSAYHKVIGYQKGIYSAGYDEIFDRPSTIDPKTTVGETPVDTTPILQKIDELQATVAKRGMQAEESAATKKLLDDIRSRVGGGGTGDPTKFMLSVIGYTPDEIAGMSRTQLANWKQDFIDEKSLNLDGSLPGPKAGEAPNVDQMHGFRTVLRNLRGARATNTTRWISNELEATTNDVMTKGMTSAGATPQDFDKFAKLDQKWGTISEMQAAFKNLDGAKYGHVAANALWDIAESKKTYETFNDFFKMAQNAAKVDPEIMPALRESFLTKVVGDARIAGATDLNAQRLIMRKLTDTFRGNTPDVMVGMFGKDSPFADVRQFTNVMGRAVDPNTTNKLSSTMQKMLSTPARVATYGASGFFLFRLGYALATGKSPWQDLNKNPLQFAQGMAEVATVGAIASIILTRGSAIQQKAWAEMMLNPESASKVQNFVEAATPLVAQQVMKTQQAQTNSAAPAR
jgi:hypothetical protein